MIIAQLTVCVAKNVPVMSRLLYIETRVLSSHISVHYWRWEGTYGLLFSVQTPTKRQKGKQVRPRLFPVLRQQMLANLMTKVIMLTFLKIVLEQKSTMLYPVSSHRERGHSFCRGFLCNMCFLPIKWGGRCLGDEQ